MAASSPSSEIRSPCSAFGAVSPREGRSPHSTGTLQGHSPAESTSPTGSRSGSVGSAPTPLPANGLAEYYLSHIVATAAVIGAYVPEGEQKFVLWIRDLVLGRTLDSSLAILADYPITQFGNASAQAPGTDEARGWPCLPASSSSSSASAEIPLDPARPEFGMVMRQVPVWAAPQFLRVRQMSSGDVDRTTHFINTVRFVIDNLRDTALFL